MTEQDDSYGSTIREAMKRSMGRSAGEYKRLNVREVSFWYKVSECAGLGLWILAVLIAGSIFWMAVNGIESLFRG